jgi:3-hydroxyisobutyrate dehydrogenase-like beta-hydroxyacid dehydrogenase
MDIAMIGFGKMGANVAQRLMNGGHAVKKAD